MSTVPTDVTAAAGPTGPTDTGGPGDGATDRPEPEVRSWGWHLLQVSSWVLLVMLPIHLAMTWLVHDPGQFGVGTFVDRWHSGLWRIFDWTFIVLALVHGGIGLNGVVGSRASTPRARRAVALAIGGVLGAVGLAASIAIARFTI